MKEENMNDRIEHEMMNAAGHQQTDTLLSETHPRNRVTSTYDHNLHSHYHDAAVTPRKSYYSQIREKIITYFDIFKR